MDCLGDYEYCLSAVPVYGGDGIETWDISLPEELLSKTSVQSLAKAFADLAGAMEGEE